MCLALRVCVIAFVVLFMAPCGCSLLPTEPTLQRARSYKFKPDSQWVKINKGESDEAYKTQSGNVFTLTSSCNRHADASLEVLTRHLLLGERKIDYLEQKRVQVDNTEALYSHVKSQYEKKKFYMMIVVLSKVACIFDFTLLSPEPILKKDESQFWNALSSFSYGKN